MKRVMSLSFHLFHGVFLTTLTLSIGVSNLGSQFVVVFMENILDNSQQDLYLLNPNTFPVDVQVSAPRSPGFGPLVEVEIPAGESTLVNVDPRLNPVHTGISDHGIFVESKDNITVQAYSQSLATVESDSTGGFMVLPVEALGTEYMVVTHCETYSCQFAISSPVDVSIEVDLKINGASGLNFEGKYYYNGDSLSLNILAFQVVQLQVSADLTGTLVRTSEPAALFVGSDWTYIQPWRFDDQGDFMQEQMPPINTFGWNYVIVSFPERSSEDWVNLVAPEEDIVVVTSIGAIIPISYREQKEFDLLSGTGRYLNSTGRLIVVHYTKSPETKFVTNTDPSMIIVHPVEQWKTPCPFVIHDIPPTYLDTLVVVYANSSCRNSARVTATDIPPTYWKNIDDTGFITVTLSLTNGMQNLYSTSSSCTGFAGFIYGRATDTALSLSFGAHVNIIHKPLDASEFSSTSIRAESTVSTSLTTWARETSLSSLYIASTSLVTALTSGISSVSPAIEATSASSQTLLTNSQTAVSSSIASIAVSQTPVSLASSSNEILAVPSITPSDELLVTPSLTYSFGFDDVSSSSIWISLAAASDGDGNGLTTIMTSTAINTASSFEPSNSIFSHSASYRDDGTSGISQTMASESIDSTPSLSAAASITTSPQPSTSSLTITTSVSSKQSYICKCGCLETNEPLNVRIEHIRDVLKMDTSFLSKTIRKKISIPDGRRSAAVIGWSAIVFIVGVLAVLALADVLNLCLYLMNPQQYARKRLLRD